MSSYALPDQVHVHLACTLLCYIIIESSILDIILCSSDETGLVRLRRRRRGWRRDEEERRARGLRRALLEFICVLVDIQLSFVFIICAYVVVLLLYCCSVSSPGPS